MTAKSIVHRPLGRTGLQIPPVIFGTSSLGNVYEVLPEETKFAIVSNIVHHSPAPAFFDTAGKYGAGLALEVLGSSLRKLDVPASRVVICNKLGWYRTPLRGPEPTFERGVWAGINHDAELRISHDGILECYEQGCQLLGEGHTSQMIGVHDPDEYLAATKSPSERTARLEDLVGAYRAMCELKRKGLVRAVGVGAKDWRTIRELAGRVDLDWVMFACSLTVYSHPPELLEFIGELQRRGVGMINSAVFNSGFLIGGPWFNYRKPDPAKEAGLYAWRERFLAVCRRFNVKPVDACVQFGLAAPGIAAVALNSRRPENIEANLASVTVEIPPSFWQALVDEGLVDRHYPLPV